MRHLGTGLLVAGAAIGVAVGGAMLMGVGVVGMPWLVTVGLTKLALLSSGGLMAAGAACLRLDRRAGERPRLPREPR